MLYTFFEGIGASMSITVLLYPYLYLLLDAKDLSDVGVGLPSAACGIAFAITTLPIGWYSDKYSRLSPIRLSIPLCVAAIIIFTTSVWIENFTFLVVSQALIGFGYAFQVAPVQAITADSTSTGSERTEVLIILGSKIRPFTAVLSCFIAAAVFQIIGSSVWTFLPLQVLITFGGLSSVIGQFTLTFLEEIYKNEQLAVNPNPGPTIESKAFKADSSNNLLENNILDQIETADKQPFNELVASNRFSQVNDLCRNILSDRKFLVLFSIVFAYTSYYVGGGLGSPFVALYFEGSPYYMKPGDYLWYTGCVFLMPICLSPVSKYCSTLWGRPIATTLLSVISTIMWFILAAYLPHIAYPLIANALRTGLQIAFYPLIKAIYYDNLAIRNYSKGAVVETFYSLSHSLSRLLSGVVYVDYGLSTLFQISGYCYVFATVCVASTIFLCPNDHHHMKKKSKKSENKLSEKEGPSLADDKNKPDEDIKHK